MEPPRGAPKVQLLGDGNEISKVSEFYILIHISKIIIRINKILDVMNP